MTYEEEMYHTIGSTDSGGRSSGLATLTLTNSATKTDVIPDSADAAEEEGTAPPLGHIVSRTSTSVLVAIAGDGGGG